MRRLLAALAVAAVAVAGCGFGPSKNQDPRKGRVITRHTNCLTNDCTYDWKVCVGPDLIVHIDGSRPADHTLKNSPECVR